MVCAIALTTRLLPDVWPIGPNLANDRLSYPLTYWNALGLLASLGIVFSSTWRPGPAGRGVTRVLGAAAIPLLATTVYFTFSRGAILAGVIGDVAYLVLARPRGAVSGLVAAVPPRRSPSSSPMTPTCSPPSTRRPRPRSPRGIGVAWVLAACIVGAALSGSPS